MPLVIGIEEEPSENCDFYVGDTRVVVQQILGPLKFKLRVEEPAINRVMEITDALMTDILPGVRASAARAETATWCGLHWRPRVISRSCGVGCTGRARRMPVRRVNKSGHKEYLFDQQALGDAKVLLPELSVKELNQWVIRSAPVTHPKGNRRYREYVFDTRGSLVKGIALFKSNRYGRELEDTCEACHGRGWIELIDTCAYCEGEGCEVCHGKETRRRMTCPEPGCPAVKH